VSPPSPPSSSSLNPRPLLRSNIINISIIVSGRVRNKGIKISKYKNKYEAVGTRPTENVGRYFYCSTAHIVDYSCWGKQGKEEVVEERVF